MVESPRRGSLLVIFLTVFIDLLGFGMVLPLLPLYGEQFHASPATLGLLMASFSAMQFLFAPLWGRLSDRIGRRPVLLLGLGGSVVFYTLFGVATVFQSLVGLFVARVGAGIAGATISTAQAYIADSTTLENRAKGMALIGAAFGLGFTFGPLLGALALPSGSEQAGPGPGYLAAALSAGAFALALFKLPESLDPSITGSERHWLDLTALAAALKTPSIGPLLVAFFICILSFANFETTLSLLLKGETEQAPFQFNLQQVGWTFAYIGLTLTFAQGVLVRRMAGKISEGRMASAGALLDIVGFLALLYAISARQTTALFIALSLVVIGFAFMMPSLNALISRRSDPAKQGGILGVTQSVSSLARILGPMLGIPLHGIAIGLPYWLATALMTLGLALVIVAARGGRDFATADMAPPIDLEI
ncbi:MAG TPA: MFS transporter [Pirellulales bacterium]|nr:MFS transporter [Pirellulales bacterium]